MDDITLNHESRISKLEESFIHIREDLDKLVLELSSLRRAVWSICMVLLITTGGPSGKELIKLILTFI